MAEQVTFESYILGGLPVEVTATIHPGEGASWDYPGHEAEVEIDEICWGGKIDKRTGRRKGGGGEIPKHMMERLTNEEFDRLAERALEAL